MKVPRAGSRVAAASSGALLASAFAPLEWSALAWVALVPLLYAIDGERPARAFRLGWLAGAVFFGLTFTWIPGTITRTTGAPGVVTIVPLVVLASVLAVYVGVFASALRFVDARLPRYFAAYASLAWVALEWVRGWAVLPCPWELLGVSQGANLPLVQIAEVTGVYGVSALVVCANAVLYEWIARRPGAAPRLTAVVLTVVAVAGYGSLRIRAVEALRGERTVRLGLVQPAIDPNEKWDPARRIAVLELQEDLARRAADDGAELVIWPEASAPFVFASDELYAVEPERFAEDRARRDELLAFFRDLHRPLLFGSPTLTRHALGRGETWRSLNRALLADADGSIVARYDKTILVPFGEYVPWPRLLFFVDKLVPGVGDFEPGGEPTLFPLGDSRFATVVCYEAIFPDFVRKFVDRGASLLVNQTNDAWFGDGAGPAQHLALAKIRAIETRTPLVRVANTGISVVVDPSGRERLRIGLGERVARVIAVEIGNRPATFYVRHGDAFARAAALAALVLLVYAGWTSRAPEPLLVGA